MTGVLFLQVLPRRSNFVGVLYIDFVANWQYV